jgi:S-adenosylmethionine:tRNA ribosyltransferase-isomerase
MKTSDFSFELPNHLIAQYPPEKRGQSRLMVLDRVTGTRSHRMVEELPEILCGPEFRSKDGGMPLLVFNDSKVRKARLIGKSWETGAQVEFLLLERIGRGGKTGGGGWGGGSRGKSGNGEWGMGSRDRSSDNDIASEIYANTSNNNPHSPLPTPYSQFSHSTTWKAMVQRSKRRKNGSTYAFYDKKGAIVAKAIIAGGAGELRLLAFDRNIDDNWLDLHGHIPLPPYIKRQDTPEDSERYQTVYAAVSGSSAAPTAGLHFTRELMDRLAVAGIDTAFITLHVGLGTFLPVRCSNIEEHIMHTESFTIDEHTAIKIETAKAQGRKIIAIGTTTVRTLESANNFPHRPLSLLKQTCISCNSGRHLGSRRADSNQETQLDTALPSVSPLPTPHSPLPTPILKRGEGSTSIFIYPGYQFKIVDALFTNFHTPESTLLMLAAAFAGRERLLESYAEAIDKEYRFFSYGDAMLIS